MEGQIIGAIVRKKSASFRRTIPSYELALDAFREARYFDALDHLRGVGFTPNSFALELRVLLRLGRLDDARAAIARHGARIAQNVSNGEIAVIGALAGRVFEVSGNEEIASEWYARAYDHSLRSENPEFVAEAHYFFGLSANSKRNIERVEMHVQEVLKSQQPWLRALGQILRATRELFSANYEGARNAYEAALLLFATENEARDRGAEATCLQQYVGVLHLRNATSFSLPALSYYDDFAWTDELSGRRFETALDLAELFSNWGDDIRAYRLLRDAEDCAPDEPSLLWVRSSRCVQAFSDGEVKFARNELNVAKALYRRIDWANVHLDHRLALLDFAVAAAPIECEAAEEALAIYRALPAERSALYADSSDPRVRAREFYTFGVVAAAKRETDVAASMFRETIAIANSMDFLFLEHRASEGLAALGAVRAETVPDPALTQAQERNLVEMFLPPARDRIS